MFLKHFEILEQQAARPCLHRPLYQMKKVVLNVQSSGALCFTMVAHGFLIYNHAKNQGNCSHLLLARAVFTLTIEKPSSCYFLAFRQGSVPSLLG